MYQWRVARLLGGNFESEKLQTTINYNALPTWGGRGNALVCNHGPNPVKIGDIHSISAEENQFRGWIKFSHVYWQSGVCATGSSVHIQHFVNRRTNSPASVYGHRAQSVIDSPVPESPTAIPAALKIAQNRQIIDFFYQCSTHCRPIGYPIVGGERGTYVNTYT